MISNKAYFDDATMFEVAKMATGVTLLAFGFFEIFRDLPQGMLMQLFGLYIFDRTTSGIRARWIMEALEEEDEGLGGL